MTAGTPLESTVVLHKDRREKRSGFRVALFPITDADKQLREICDLSRLI